MSRPAPPALTDRVSRLTALALDLHWVWNDGWWSEAFEPSSGWAIGDRIDEPDDDREDAAELYARLENEIVPAFYERDADGLPRQWLARMRSSMASLAPRFSSARMLEEYVEQAYLPAAASCKRRAADDAAAARDLGQWSRRLEEHWSGIRFGEVAISEGRGRLSVSLPVWLGAIGPDDVRVQLYASPHDTDDAIVQAMTAGDAIAGTPNAFVYRATVETMRPAWHFTPRVVPSHADARIPAELPLIAWQR